MSSRRTENTTASLDQDKHNTGTNSSDNESDCDSGIDAEFDYESDILWPWVRRNAITAMAFRHRAMIQDPSTGDRVRGIAETTIIYFPIRQSGDPEDFVTERAIWIKFRDSTNWKPQPRGTRVQLYPRKNGMVKLYIRDLKPHEVPQEMHSFFRFEH